MSVRSHRYTVCNRRLFNHRIGNNRLFTDNRVNNIRTICQNAACANFRLTFQGNIGFNLYFWFNLYVYINISCFWTYKANPIHHMSLVDSATHNSFGSRKSYTVIDTKTFIKVFQSISADFFAILTENADYICDVVFSLRIVGIDIFQGFKKTSVIKNIRSCIDFFDLLFKIRSILLLHNFDHFFLYGKSIKHAPGTISMSGAATTKPTQTKAPTSPATKAPTKTPAGRGTTLPTAPTQDSVASGEETTLPAEETTLPTGETTLAEETTTTAQPVVGPTAANTEEPGGISPAVPILIIAIILVLAVAAVVIVYVVKKKKADGAPQ